MITPAKIGREGNGQKGRMGSKESPKKRGKQRHREPQDPYRDTVVAASSVMDETSELAIPEAGKVVGGGPGCEMPSVFVGPKEELEGISVECVPETDGDTEVVLAGGITELTVTATGLEAATEAAAGFCTFVKVGGISVKETAEAAPVS